MWLWEELSIQLTTPSTFQVPLLRSVFIPCTTIYPTSVVHLRPGHWFSQPLCHRSFPISRLINFLSYDEFSFGSELAKLALSTSMHLLTRLLVRISSWKGSQLKALDVFFSHSPSFIDNDCGWMRFRLKLLSHPGLLSHCSYRGHFQTLLLSGPSLAWLVPSPEFHSLLLQNKNKAEYIGGWSRHLIT